MVSHSGELNSGELKPPGTFELTSKTKGTLAVLMFVGLITFIVTLVNNPSRAWHAYLIGMFYVMSLSLGGFFFTAIQHVTKAGWSVNIRRFSEAFINYLPIGAITAVIFLFGAPTIYDWLNPEVVAKDHLLAHKASYLNQTFFYIRMVAFFALWIVLGKTMVGNSVKQDKTGDVNLTHKNVAVSVFALLVFALTYSFFSVDTMMALEAHWFSTIFGVYAFAGLFQSTVALMILIILKLMSTGQLKGYVTEDHIHDLGKFLFAFTVFWAYIAFSQYMLIWYANLPEESFFFQDRSAGPWAWVSIFLILFKFVVPFFALLPRWAKRTPGHLAMVSILILIMQFVDLFWVAYPHYDQDHVVVPWIEVLVLLGFLALFLWATFQFLKKNSIVPLKDPRQHESLHHHVVY
ncbi:MAG: molybdopterin oxidoreductase [Bdellovibrionales bacterium]|nr:molybdopterin oxidoreductase [Bdellovibrionales bacterium]